MPRYRKKPVVIEVVQFLPKAPGNSFNALPEWLEDACADGAVTGVDEPGKGARLRIKPLARSSPISTIGSSRASRERSMPASPTSSRQPTNRQSEQDGRCQPCRASRAGRLTLPARAQQVAPARWIDRSPGSGSRTAA
jgi:hypothetical protein